MNSALLSVHELFGGYRDVIVIRGISASVGSGEVAFVTGRNGVGKSTLVKLIVGHLPLTSGQIAFGERNLSATPAHRRRLFGLGYAPQERFTFDELTIVENLTLHYSSRALDRYDDLFDCFPYLPARLTQNGTSLVSRWP